MANDRRMSSAQWEASLAMLALAGLREVTQALHTAVATSNTAYTVTGANTRRVMCLHLGTGATDIRIKTNGAATGDSMPMVGQTYFVFDAAAGDTINFYNTTLGNIMVYVMELC